MNESDIILGAGLSNSLPSKPTLAQIRKKTHQRVVAQDPHNFSSYVYPRSLRLGLAERRRGNAHSLEEFVARTLLARQGIDVDDIVLCGDTLLGENEIVDVLVGQGRHVRERRLEDHPGILEVELLLAHRGPRANAETKLSPGVTQVAPQGRCAVYIGRIAHGCKLVLLILRARRWTGKTCRLDVRAGSDAVDVQHSNSMSCAHNQLGKPSSVSL